MNLSTPIRRHYLLASDLNGTLVLDTRPSDDCMDVYAFRQTGLALWNKYAGAWSGRKELEKFLGKFTKADCAHKSYEDGLQMLCDQFHLLGVEMPSDKSALLMEMKQIYDDVVCSEMKENALRLGTVQFLKWAHQQNYPITIATNASRRVVDHSLGFLPIQIALAVTADETRSKPAPDSFLKVYEWGVTKAEGNPLIMFSIEDTVVGWIAAIEAARQLSQKYHPDAMKIFGVPTKAKVGEEMMKLITPDVAPHVHIFKPETISRRPLHEKLRQVFTQMAVLPA